MVRSSRWIVCAFVALGCGPVAQKASKSADPATSLANVELRLSVRRESPLVDALVLRLGEWEARTGGKVRLDAVDQVDPSADVLVVHANQVLSLPTVPYSSESLADPNLNYREIPPAYRTVFNQKDDKIVALPLSTERLLLWYRTDLFSDPAIAEETKRRTGQALAVPRTWEEYAQVARFLKESGKVPFGCAEAMTRSPESARNYLARCAALAKGPNWVSFAIDADTGEVLLDRPPYEQGLEWWKQAWAASPAADGSAVDEAMARKLFAEGKVGMLVSTLPPTIPTGTEKIDAKVADATGVADLPGSKSLTDPRTSKVAEVDAINRPVHYAGAGELVILGQGRHREAAEALARFLADGRECHYLVQAAKRGYFPLRPALLEEARRFRALGLSTGTATNLMFLLNEGLVSQNWVADFRFPGREPFLQDLAEGLEPALRGNVLAGDALRKVKADWTQRIEADKPAFLAEFRRSLGLPAPLAP